MSLSDQKRLFVEAYGGDIVVAMQIAGYVGTPAQLLTRGNLLLQEPLVVEAIRVRSLYTEKTRSAVASKEECQEYWTQIMRNEDPDKKEIADKQNAGMTKVGDENIPYSIRLKASELLGKSRADFTENVNHQGTVSITDLVSSAYKIPDSDLDDIEAEYHEKKKQDRLAHNLPPEETEEPPTEEGIGAFI